MTTYAIAQLRRPATALHPDVFTYMEEVQATLDPFAGRFLVHGGRADVLEGSWGDIVVVEFPTAEQARAWYDSPAYRRILPMRIDHLDCAAVLVDGVAPGHDSAAMGRAMREMQLAATGPTER